MLSTLDDALLEELKDLYSAENQLVPALAEMEEKAHGQGLKDMFRSHGEVTRRQIDRLVQVQNILGEDLSGKRCHGMAGLIQEGREAMQQEAATPAVLDAMLLGCARRIEHYEIAAYSSALAICDEIGEDDVSKALQATLREEGETESRLRELGASEVLLEASSGAARDEGAQPEPGEELH